MDSKLALRLKDFFATVAIYVWLWRGTGSGYEREMANESGYVDGLIGGSIEGWALGHDRSQPATVRLEIDGQPCGTAVCDQFREDLHTANLRNGYAKFQLAPPRQFRDGQVHRAVIVNLSTGQALEPGAIEFRLTNKANERHLLVRSATYHLGGKDTFVHDLRTRKRLAILASFGKSANFRLYQRALVKELSTNGYVVLIVRADGTSVFHETAAELEGASCIIRRVNLGYDFGSWATGLDHVAEEWDHLNELLLINDSNFGSILSLTDRLKEVRSSFVCLTDSYQHCYHAQSYFMRFGRVALREGSLAEFFDLYEYPADKAQVIGTGELQLTEVMSRSGFELDVLYPYERLAGRWLDQVGTTINEIDQLYERLAVPKGKQYEARMEAISNIAESILNNIALNPTHFFWRTLIREFGYPFIKRELILKNPASIPDLIFAVASSEIARLVEPRHIQDYTRYEGGGVPTLSELGQGWPRERIKSLEKAAAGPGTGSIDPAINSHPRYRTTQLRG